MKNLHYIIFTGSNGDSCVFRLLERVSSNWRRFGLKLDISRHRLDDIGRLTRGDTEECWVKIMYYWLDGCSSHYPPTWEGMYKLLYDIQCLAVAKDLEFAVNNAVVE